MFLLWLRQLPRCGDQTPASVPTPTEGRSSPSNTVFLTSSFGLLRFCMILYILLLVRYSCLLPTGVLHALLCLKVYSWCIPGERCTPCPPIHPPSCSLSAELFYNKIFFLFQLCVVFIENVPNDKYINILPTLSYLIKTRAWDFIILTCQYAVVFLLYLQIQGNLQYLYIFRTGCLNTALEMGCVPSQMLKFTAFIAERFCCDPYLAHFF